MFGSEVLDIVIGLIFIYLLYSLFATIIQEIIATHFGFRAKILEKGIMRMVDDDFEKDIISPTLQRLQSFLLIFKSKRNQPPITKAFYGHPLIKYLGEDKWHSKPAYLSSENFSKVIIDLLRGVVKPGDDVRSKIDVALTDGKINWTAIENHSNPELKSNTTEPVKINKETLSYLQSIWADSQGDVEKFKSKIEDWYNETMERVSGWYKQYTQIILFFVGLIIAITFNVDTLKIVEKLEKDPKLREQLVAQADAYVQTHPNLDKELAQQKEENKQDGKGFGKDSASKVNESNSKSIQEFDIIKKRRDSLLNAATDLVKNDISKANNLLGIGHSTQQCQCCCFDIACQVKCFFTSLLGWIITAIALSLGAPFWFDLLNKLIKLRGAVKNNDDKSSNTGGSTQVPNIKRVG